MIKFLIDKIINSSIVFLFLYFIVFRKNNEKNNIKNIVLMYFVFVVISISVSYILMLIRK